MKSQLSWGVPQLKFRHKIHEIWIILVLQFCGDSFTIALLQNRKTILLSHRGGTTAFRQWGQDFLFISLTAFSPNFNGGNKVVLPPQLYHSEGKLPPLPYGAHGVIARCHA